jgi:glycosyltransferase involved in cell wall biosynthesis
MSLKIDHVTFAPSGGAGIVAKTLWDFQNRLGNDVELHTLVDSGLRSDPVAHPILTAKASIDEFVIKSPKHKGMFSHMRRDFGSFRNLPLRENSLVHLHWIEGVVTHYQVRNLLNQGRSVVWTLHDEAPFTGGCHSSLNCNKYQEFCQDCPAARPIFAKRILKSHESLIRAGLDATSIRLVTPSRWLKKAAESSSVFRDLPVTLIRNPISVEYFSAPTRDAARSKLRIPDNAFVGIVVAAQLDNPIKQVKKLAELFFETTDTHGFVTKLLLIGANGDALKRVHGDVMWLGELEAQEISQILPAADFLASASLSESAGMTVKEAGAAGVPSIVFRNGGSEELVDDGVSGFLVSDFESFREKVLYLAQNPKHKFVLGEEAKESALDAHPQTVAEKYLQFYGGMI